MTAGSDLPNNRTVPIDLAAATPLTAARPPRRRVYLFVVHRDEVITVPLAAGNTVVIGREPPADVVIPDKSLSRRHAELTLGGGDEVTVEDLGSTNGTRIGGKPVQRATLRPGEEVLLGTVAASVHVVTNDDARPLGPEGHEAFRAALEAELRRARYLGRPLAVLMVRSLERQGEGGAAWIQRVQALVRPIDRVSLYAAGVVEVLLVETGSDKALEIARALTEPASTGAALCCGVALFPGHASAEELIEASLDASRRTTAAQPVQAAANEGHRTLAVGGDADGGDGPVMESAAMQQVAQTAAQLATAVIPVLIHGETGTGKEVLARLIHEGGPRRARPLIAVNCAAIPADLLESILFGHEKGSFTGAVQQKGLFEAAEGGTILLDELGELPLDAQAKLLRALEEKRIRRVGSVREIEVDVRVLAATNRDLEAMVAAGKFREDLFYRLNAMEMTLPPLRERRQDIAPLAARFALAAAKTNGRAVKSISPEAIGLLERHSWPGNVRELRNAIDRAVVMAQGETITPFDLPPRVRGSGAPPKAAAGPRYTGSLKSRMERFETEMIIEALREADDNQTQAAKILEMPLRTLQFKIKEKGIERKVQHGAGEPDG